MSSGIDVNVDYCIVELIPKRRDKEGESVFLESAPFTYQSSECRVKVSYGWENKERKGYKVFVKSQPLLLPKFYVTVCVFKDSHSITYPKQVVLDPSRFIWSASFADIEKQIPDVERWKINFRIIFQTGVEPNSTKNFGHKFVQTSSCLTESDSLEKFSNDFARLLERAQKADYYDIVVKCGDVVIKAHKALLIARSPFFRRKLQSLTENKIELQYIDPAAFHEIMQYIYTGKPPDLSLETAKKIYKAGEICNTELRERCVEFLFENLTLDNACEYLTLTDDESFRERIVQYIIEKGIPYLDEYWKPFCDQHPKFANVVYDKHVRQLQQEVAKLRGALPTGTSKKFLYNYGEQ